MNFESIDSLSVEDFKMSFGELLNLSYQNEIDIYPAYKVGLFWDRVKKSRFVESALLGLPLNNFVFEQDEYGYFKVVDGAERLSSILEYFDNSFELIGLTMLTELNGLSIEHLPYVNRVKLKRALFSVTVLGRHSSPELKCELYKRLNIGKYGFEEQEARNYAYPEMHLSLQYIKDSLSSFFNFRLTRESHGKRKLRMRLKEEQFLLCLILIQGECFQENIRYTHFTLTSALDYLAKKINNKEMCDDLMANIKSNLATMSLKEVNLINRSYKDKNRYNEDEMSMSDFLKLYFVNLFGLDLNVSDIKFNFSDENSQLTKLGRYL